MLKRKHRMESIKIYQISIACWYYGVAVRVCIREYPSFVLDE